MKGFTEALITDLRINAPHIKCSVVMPGHIGTSIVANSRKIQSGNESGRDEPRRDRAGAGAHRRDGQRCLAAVGRRRPGSWSPSARAASSTRRRPRAAQAATIILDGVKADRWRILVGEDAHKIDELVRQSPERAYDVDFFQSFAAEVGWRIGR